MPKLLYLSLNLSVYSIYIHISNYFKDIWDIPIHSYGYIAGLTTAGFFGSILWTILADKTKKHKLILILTSLGFMASFCLLRFEFFIDRDGVHKYVFVSTTFIVANFFASALYPLLDSRIFAMLAKNHNFTTKLYGQQRLWGSIGQALIIQLNAFGLQRAIKYDAIFINLVWTTLLFITCVVIGIPNQINDFPNEEQPLKEKIEEMEEKIPDAEKPMAPIDTVIGATSPRSMHEESPTRPIFKLLGSVHFLFFLLIILFQGYCRGILGHFLTEYFHTTLKQSPVTYSLMLNTRLVSEILLFFWGKPLLLYFGDFAMMLVGLLAGSLRVFAYAVIPTTKNWSYGGFAFEILKGVNSACVIMAGVKITHELAPAGCETTAQGFFSGIHSNLANALSGFLGGLLLNAMQDDPKAVQKLFLLTAIVSFISCGMFLFKQLIYPHRCNT